LTTNPKTLAEMTPDEQATAIGTCAQGRRLILQEGGLTELLSAFAAGRYSDDVMTAVVQQTWRSVRDRAVLIADGFGNLSTFRDGLPAFSAAQWAAMTGATLSNAVTNQAALRFVHDRCTRVREAIAEGRRRVLVDELDELIRFIALAGGDRVDD
jgi:hypothetical protein